MVKWKMEISCDIVTPILSVKKQILESTVDLYLTVGVIVYFSLLYLLFPFTIESFLVTLEGIIGTDFSKPFVVLFRRVSMSLKSDSLFKPPLLVLHLVHDRGVS